MKLYKLFKLLLALSFLLTTSINISLAAGIFETCPGVARELSWSSSNASTNPGSCYGVTSGVNSTECRFTPLENTPGNKTVTINTLSGTCNATISCTGPGSATPISDTATLNVVNKAECCGTGSQLAYTGGWQAGNGGYCSCPVGQYKDPVTKACRNLIPPTITATSSGLLNPIVTPTCSAPMITKLVVRDNGPNTNLAVNGNTPITDLAIKSLTSAATYTYTLTCEGTGDNSHITQTAMATMTVPPRVVVTSVNQSVTPTGSPVTATWNSTGNQCTIHDNLGSMPAIKTATRSGTAPNYSYSVTMSPSAPEYRTELNSSHTGTGILGYVIKCIDTNQQIRGTGENIFKAEVFKKPVATITQNGNNLSFLCTPDYNKVDIKANGTSLARYPRIYEIALSSNFAANITPLANTTYLLTCSYGNYSDQDQLTTNSGINSLELYGSIQGIAGSANSIISVNSPDGLINNLSYTAENADSVTVTRNGSNVSTGIYAPISGKARVTQGQDQNIYNNFELFITAIKGSITKTLTLKMVKTNDPKAKIVVTSDSTTTNPDQVNINIRCDNSDSYKLYKNGSSAANIISSGSTGSDNPFTKTIIDTATSTTNKTTYKVECISGAQISDASAEIDIVSKTPVKISALIIRPEQIACPGGNDSATLNLIMSSTVGKVCRIIPSAINADPNRTEKNVQMSALNTQLSSRNYVSSNSVGKKSLTELMSDRNSSGVVGGSIVLSSTSKLSTEKRLFTYSTRFKLECDSATEPIATQYRPGNVTYSTKSVDMLSTCIGQD